MSEPTLYQPDLDRMYDDERQMFDGLVKYGRLVPVEPETLYELGVKRGPGGGQCVLCGGSIKAVRAVRIGGDDER